MARKKSRQARPPQEGSRAGSSTAVVAQPSVTGVATAPPSPAPAPAKPGPSVKLTKTGPAYLFFRLAHSLGSLQIAVVGLTLFAVCLAVGTIVESWYSGKLAQELVYRSWWFALLIGVLGVNIFCAAAKKWPWKKHQTGFIITHAGLLMLVAGGILNALGGVDAAVVMIDSRDPEARQNAGGARPETKVMIDRDSGQLVVKWLGHGGKVQSQSYAFDPGSLPWQTDKVTKRRPDPLVNVLGWMSHPLPHEWSQTLPDGAELQVLAYYPYVREGKFKAAEDGKSGFPAVRYTLSSPMAGPLPDGWVALHPGAQTSEMGVGMVEFLGVCPRSLLDEFRNPPDPKELGDKGILVLSLNGDKVRLPVDRSLSVGETAHLGGWEVKVTRYSPDPQKEKEDPKAPPVYPVVEFQLKSADGKETADLATAARDAGHFEEVHRRPAALAGLQVWYHPPDYQYGRKSHEGQRDGLRALMQLVQGDDGKLYYRSFSTSRLGKFAFEKAGEARPGKDELAIWTGMNWKFQLDEYLPAAVAEDQWVPEDLRPGSERNGYYPAALCQITKDGKKSKDFWVLQFNDATPVSVTDHDYYTVGYTMRTQDLGFSLRLLRAEQTNDAGTQSAATYTSFVQLTDDEQHIKDEDHVITMNAPLHHRGYKFYQSGYELVGVESGSQKPISKSTLTVGYDPGIYLKYLGQIMLGVGIFTMFYMKAYFFKPRRRAVPAAATSNGAPAGEG